jgi:RNA-directed DNA polymerase
MNTVMPMYRWDTIPWQHIQRSVFKLQKRIYQASRRGEKPGQEVRMTNAALLRSRMKANLHVRF